MYTSFQAEEFQRDAARLKLKYPRCFIKIEPDKLAGIINGYGPESWDVELRKILTWIFRKYPVPAAIHDVRYEFSDNRESTRKAADAEFAANLLIVWKYNYGRYRVLNPVAWYAYWKIRTAAGLTAKFGRKAWKNAYKNKNKKVEK